ncbi:MAG: ABC transporter ATP-binding protein [Euryarchaeota archaeon]|nr:ABC transporter ATP-binding protein [Euryarchaeota archaeon]
MNAIVARGIEKRFKKTEALRGVDLEVPEGTVYGLLGPNGAGKTTLISILSTLLLPDRGTAEIMGINALRHPERVRGLINLTSGHPNFLWSLTLRENLTYFSMLYGLDRQARQARIAELAALLELGPHLHTRFEALSTGLKQRMALAKALLNRPRVLFLDEPTLGLDPDVALRVREFIARLHREGQTTILLTSHNMAEVEELCERIAFLRQGRKVAEGTPGELKRRVRLDTRVHLRLSSPDIGFLQGAPGLRSIKTEDRLATLVVEGPSAIPGLLSRLDARGVRIEEMRVEEPDLEDAFLDLAKGGNP